MSSTHLCVPITASTLEESVSILQDPAPSFDIAEIRLDYLERPDIARLLEVRACPLIFTNRSVRDQGRWTGDEGQRLALLEEADALGADYIDIEIDHLAGFERKGNSNLIVSYHNFDETPKGIEDIAREIDESPGDVVKVATRTQTLYDHLSLIRILRAARKPTIAVSMGSHGYLSRILAPKFGAFLVFASMERGRESAPGQIPASELIEQYRFREIGPETQVYGTIGNPLRSRSAAKLLNASFRCCGLDALAVPLPESGEEELAEFSAEIPIAGISEIQEETGPFNLSWLAGQFEVLTGISTSVDVLSAIIPE
jgi:3-dehydroquinate dehydratase/shikimate dehydrogenase